MAKRDRVSLSDGPIPVRITVFPKKYGPAPDKDNCVSAAKAYLDGIADAIGVNDRNFASPIVLISQERTSRMVIEIGNQVLKASPPARDLL